MGLKDNNIVVPSSPSTAHPGDAHPLELGRDQLRHDLAKDVVVRSTAFHIAFFGLRENRSHEVIRRAPTKVCDVKLVQWQDIPLNISDSVRVPAAELSA
jgi:hypothetical protein